MFNRRLVSITVLSVLALSFGSSFFPAGVSEAAGCSLSVEQVKAYRAQGTIQILRGSGHNAYRIVNNTDCSFPVTTYSARMIESTFNQVQFFIAYSTVPPHSNELYWIQVPADCGYQYDIWYGNTSEEVNRPLWPTTGLDGLQVGSACASQTPQCRDGIDNDGDGATDFPADFSCSNADDNDETNPKSQCQDGIDNDQDGKVDFPQDPGCSSKQDNDESNVMTPALPACSDGIDNDNDGKTDFFDAGCYPNNVFNPALYNPNDTDESNAAALCRWTRVNNQWVRSCI